MMNKVCIKCLESKALEDFAKRKSSKDGRRGECKKCKENMLTAQQKLSRNNSVKEWKKRNPEKVKKLSIEYKSKNKENIKNYGDKYYLENKENILKKQREKYLLNRDSILQYFNTRKDLKREYDKKYYENNKTKASVFNSQWKKENKDKVREYSSRRRAKFYGSSGDFTKQDIENRLKEQGGVCRYCGDKLENGYHIDHRMPLSLGGTNDFSNIQILCKSCNLRKHAKHPDIFEKQIGYKP